MNTKDITIIASGVILSLGVVYLGVRIYDDHFSNSSNQKENIETDIPKKVSKKEKKENTYEILINLGDLENDQPVVKVKKPHKTIAKRLQERVANKVSNIKIPAPNISFKMDISGDD